MGEWSAMMPATAETQVIADKVSEYNYCSLAQYG